MIEKATEAFWQRLGGLSFVGPEQIAQWRTEATKADASWLQLCQTIQRESPLTANHLQTLVSGAAHPPVAIGGCLVLRPTFHALGWEAYEARHVKLQQNWRLVVLPTFNSGRSEAYSPADAAGNLETESLTAVDPRLLGRVRALAAISFAGGPQVVDVEVWEGRTIVTMPPPAGRRLSQYWSGTRSTPQAELALADEIVRLVQVLTAAGCKLSRLDPLLLTIQESGHSLAADDLLSSEWLEDDYFPADLAAEEAAVVLDYRARRAQFLGGTANQRETAWLECAAALNYVAARLDQSGQTPESLAAAARLQNGAAELKQAAETRPEVLADWLERWFSPTPGLDSLAKLNPDILNNDDKRFFVDLKHEDNAEADTPLTGDSAANPEAGFFAGIETQVSRETSTAASSEAPLVVAEGGADPKLAKSQVTNKSGGGAIAARQAAKREQQRRQRVVTALAVGAPFPIFLGIFLIAYFLWPSGDGVPDVSNQSGGGELPVATLSESSVASLEPGIIVAAETGPTKQAQERQARRDDSQSQRTDDADRVTDDDLLADLVPTTTADDLLADLEVEATTEQTLGQPSRDVDTGDTGEARDTRETGASGQSITPTLGDSPLRDTLLVDNDTRQTAESVSEPPGPMTAKVEVMRIVNWASSEPEEEDGYVSFAGVLTAVDWTGTWRMTLGGAGGGEGSSVTGGGPVYVVSVGRVNSTTARNMLVELPTSVAGPWALRPLEVEPLGDKEIVKAWELSVRSGVETTPVARLQTTQAGHLELRFSVDDARRLPADASLTLALSDKRGDLTQMLELSGGQRHSLPGASAGGLADVAIAADAEAGVGAGVGVDAETVGEIANLAVDARSGTVKSWGGEMTLGKRENLNWHFQVAGQEFKALDPQNPTWEALKFRGKEAPYTREEVLETGALVLTVATETGNRWRVQARLHLLTPTGLRPFKKTILEEATTEATALLQGLQFQHATLKSTRAKPGGAELKQAELNRLEALIKEVERYLQAIGNAAGEAEQIFEQGVAFGVSETLGDNPVWLLKSAGFAQP